MTGPQSSSLPAGDRLDNFSKYPLSSLLRWSILPCPTDRSWSWSSTLLGQRKLSRCPVSRGLKRYCSLWRPITQSNEPHWEENMPLLAAVPLARVLRIKLEEKSHPHQCLEPSPASSQHCPTTHRHMRKRSAIC